MLLPNSFAAAWLVRRAGIRERWGYAADLRGRCCSRAIARPTRSVHQGDYYQHLVRELGIETGPLEPSLTVPDASDRSRADAADDERMGRRRVRWWRVAPGAAYGTAKRWLPAHFAELVTKLVSTGARRACSSEAQATARPRRGYSAWCRRRRARTSSTCAGVTTLSSLAGVIAHRAGVRVERLGRDARGRAVGVPVAALFGPTREYETAPLPRAGAPRRGADSPGVVPALYAAGVSDRSSLHEGAVARPRVHERA